ncbi:hypothetical protein [Arthrobacter polaris]|uniref:hypothetical protein n=1 Tax=Arthrobacter polaris TaxID=2813727 RepID=UPI001F287D53|nr:hypothetical protein [Arthrobacter polaris]UIK89180.1 hypothetical protein J0916_01460 [Arthrobacter polaris]
MTFISAAHAQRATAASTNAHSWRRAERHAGTALDMPCNEQGSHAGQPHEH